MPNPRVPKDFSKSEERLRKPIIPSATSPSWMMPITDEESCSGVQSGFSRSPQLGEERGGGDGYAQLVANLVGLQAPAEIQDESVRVEEGEEAKIQSAESLKYNRDPQASLNNLRSFVAQHPVPPLTRPTRPPRQQIQLPVVEMGDDLKQGRGERRPWWRRHLTLLAISTLLLLILLLGLIIFFATPRSLSLQITSIKPLQGAAAAYQLAKQADGTLQVNIGSLVEMRVVNGGWRDRQVDALRGEIWWWPQGDQEKKKKQKLALGSMELGMAEHSIKARGTTIITLPLEIQYTGSVGQDPVFGDYVERCSGQEGVIQVEYRVTVGRGAGGGLKAMGKGKKVQTMACPLTGAQLQALRS